MRGRLLPEGWGAALGFPAIVLDEEGPVVEGPLFRSKELDEHWQRLDEFEGDGYDRLVTAIHLESGETVDAYVYVLRGPPPA